MKVALKEIRRASKNLLNPVIKVKMSESNPLINLFNVLIDNFTFKLTLEKIVDEDKILEKIELKSKFKDLVITEKV